MRASITIAVALLVMAGMFVLTITLGVVLAPKKVHHQPIPKPIESERVLWV